MSVFQLIPMPVLYGVFMYMGFASLRNVQVGLFSNQSFHVLGSNLANLLLQCSFV